mmetsp:Transcript_14768/g.18721  ORF Transcript_14768/g.18721 Transcript_14768/m.18721 type:complete len:397 (-) Transcript_14768:248-1438(-)
MEEPQPTENAGRFKLWTLYLAFNFIILISVSSVVIDEELKSVKGWAIALAIISLLLVFATSAVHLHSGYRSIVINTKIELYIIICLVFIWAVLVGLVSSPTTGLAVEDDGAVYLGNMYYFTWAGFITGILLLASFVEFMFGISVRAALRRNNNNLFTSTNTNNNTMSNTKTPSTAFVYWCALMASSLIVMGTASDIYSRQCEVEVNIKPQPFCSRTVFAITTGTMSTIACLLIIVSKLLYITTPFLVELCLCAILFVLYIFEILYATGTNGPGSPLGNLYYFSWISFLICFGIGKCCYEDYVYALEIAETEFEEERGRTAVPSLATYGDVEGVHSDEVREVGELELGNTSTMRETARETHHENNGVSVANGGNLSPNGTASPKSNVDKDGEPDVDL